MKTQSMYTVDIDTGGTMTDALITDGTEVRSIKVDTTPHDLTVCFLNCLSEAASALGFPDRTSFLRHVRLIRWCSTITSNVLAERRGPKIGLLVSSGHEKDLYDEKGSPSIGALVMPKNIVGLEPFSESTDVLIAVKRLFEDGVRRVCVSFQGAFPENGSERNVKEIIESQFPDHYLGSVPVLLGSEMAQTPDDLTRTNYSLINAYVHTHLAASLFKADDHLRQQDHWERPLLIGHTNGGVARIGKTKAVDTIESGPIFGTFGGAFFSRKYGLESVVCLDVGGTTAKASIVRCGEPVSKRGGDLIGFPVRTALTVLRSVAIGGGSVARADESLKSVRLGPESMGASPGPACYKLGGTEATVTDAFLVLGYLDPTQFLGGRRVLDTSSARQAIESRVAKPLKMPAEKAAATVAERAFGVVADLVDSTLREVGIKPESTKLFAYGGNGPLFASAVAKRLDIPEAYVFSLGSIFGAFGSAISDVVHVYERSLMAELRPILAFEQFQSALETMRLQARRDLNGEGFNPDDAVLKLEAEVGDGQHAPVVVQIDLTEEDTNSIAKQLLAGYDRSASKGGASQTRVFLELMRLHVRYPIGAYEPALRTQANATVTDERAGQRLVNFDGTEIRVPIYQWEHLQNGSVVSGPAIGSAGNTTCLIPQGWSLTMDGFGNGLLKRQR